VNPTRLVTAVVAVLLALVPVIPLGGMREYALHVVIQIFIWSFIGQAWSLMGRFGLVSLGHGAFLGLGVVGRGSLGLGASGPLDGPGRDGGDRRG